MPRADQIRLTEKQAWLLLNRAKQNHGDDSEVTAAIRRVVGYPAGPITLRFNDFELLDLTILGSEIEECCDRTAFIRKLRQTRYSLRKKLKIIDAFLGMSAVDRLALIANTKEPPKMTARKNAYFRLVDGGVKITLTSNAWVLLILALAYDEVADKKVANPEQLRECLPSFDERARFGRSKKQGFVIPPNVIPDLLDLMEVAKNIPGGFLDGPISNIRTAKHHLEKLGLIDLLASLGT